MDKKEYTLQERLTAQLEMTEKFKSLYFQSLGAVTLLQELIKEQGDNQCKDSEVECGEVGVAVEDNPITPTTHK